MATVRGREAWEGARRARGQTWEPAAAPARADATSPGATSRDPRWLPGRAEQPALRVWVGRVPCTRARTTSRNDRACGLSQGQQAPAPWGAPRGYRLSRGVTAPWMGRQHDGVDSGERAGCAPECGGRALRGGPWCAAVLLGPRLWAGGRGGAALPGATVHHAGADQGGAHGR